MRLALLAALVGCYHPSYEDCAVSCAQSGKCPSGFECVAGMCRSMMGACGGSDQMDAPDVRGWQFRKKLVIGDVGATVLEFPVLIRITDTDLMNYAQPSGADIRFTDSMGASALPHETELYDDGTGALVAWVRVPRLVVGRPTEIYMYFGNGGAPDQQTPAAVWDASYLGVWHMGDPPGSTITDSTTAMRTGTKGATNTPALIGAGLMGAAQGFLGSTSDFVSLANAASLDRDTFTFEAWIRFSGGASTQTRRLYDVPTTFANQLTVAYQDPTAAGDKGHYFVPKLTTNERYMTPQGSVRLASWTHLMVSWAGGSPTVYANGNLLPLLLTPTGIASAPASVSIGGSPSGFDSSTLGIVDEVRLSSVARDQAYATASKTQGAEGAMLVRADPVETLF